MEVEIEYDGELIAVEIPEENLLGVITPPAAERPITSDDLLSALEETSPGLDLCSFIRNIKEHDEKLLMIINDGERPTPSHVVLEGLLPQLNSLEFLRVSIATGIHKPPSDNQLRTLLGNTYSHFKDKLHIHRARDEGAHVYVGTTSRGTEVYFDKIVCNASNILIVGSVEPHYFAGFTGGRKAFLPGHAAYRTIEHNHSFSLREEASLFNLRNNPVHLDMLEACGFLHEKNVYSIQLVLDCCGNIARALGGDLHSSFEAGIPLCKEYFAQEIPELADIVITVAEYPMDITLYQSQKAMENARSALKIGGILIFVSATREGIGDSTFADLLSSSDDLDEILKVIESGYVLGYQKTAKFIEAIKRYRVLLVTNLDPQNVKKLHMEPFSSIQKAVDLALDVKGKNAKILVIPKGSALVPRFRFIH